MDTRLEKYLSHIRLELESQNKNLTSRVAFLETLIKESNDLQDKLLVKQVRRYHEALHWVVDIFGDEIEGMISDDDFLFDGCSDKWERVKKIAAEDPDE